MIRLTAFLAFLAALFIIACDTRFDTSVLPNPNKKYSVADTSYIEISPPYGGISDFKTPVAIIVGRDQLLYVADYDSNQVVMMDASGKIIGRRTIPHPVALAQNFKLDLYVCGEAVAPNGRDTVGAVYRIYLARFDTTIAGRDTSIFEFNDIANAPMHIIREESEHPTRRFVGVGIFPGNSLILARTGPENTSFVDPDSRVLFFDNQDNFVTPFSNVVTRSSGGTAITDIDQLTGLLVFPSGYDFLIMQNNQGTEYGVLWQAYSSNANFTGWTPKFDPSDATQRSIDFIRGYRYKDPTEATVDPRKGDIFIIDEAQDSVFKFDRNGRFKGESFGKAQTASGPLPGLNHPHGIAYSNDCTLYIADTGNHLIRRFQLSIQTTCK